MSKSTLFIYGFWDRVDEAVSNSGLTKAIIANRIGCDRKTFYKDNKNRMPSPLYIARFCVITNISADWLLGVKNGD